MTIIGVTDVHGNEAVLHNMARQIRSADLVILSGDITHFGNAGDAEKVLNVVELYNNSVFAVPGNCDYPDVGAYLSERGINLDGTSRSYGRYTFAGLGGSLPTPGGNTPDERSEEMLADCLRDAVYDHDPDTPLVVVSHQPPFGASCDIAADMHVGSRSVREFIERYKPLVCFTGHIHESTCIDNIGISKLVNSGPLGGGCCSRVVLTDLNAEISILQENGSTV
jgi:Icc-related predicted phosphoesterase